MEPLVHFLDPLFTGHAGTAVVATVAKNSSKLGEPMNEQSDQITGVRRFKYFLGRKASYSRAAPLARRYRRLNSRLLIA
jgi:hypothetical protein